MRRVSSINYLSCSKETISWSIYLPYENFNTLVTSLSPTLTLLKSSVYVSILCNLPIKGILPLTPIYTYIQCPLIDFKTPLMLAPCLNSVLNPCLLDYLSVISCNSLLTSLVFGTSLTSTSSPIRYLE